MSLFLCVLPLLWRVFHCGLAATRRVRWCFLPAGWRLPGHLVLLLVFGLSVRVWRSNWRVPLFCCLFSGTTTSSDLSFAPVTFFSHQQVLILPQSRGVYRLKKPTDPLQGRLWGGFIPAMGRFNPSPMFSEIIQKVRAKLYRVMGVVTTVKYKQPGYE